MVSSTTSTTSTTSSAIPGSTRFGSVDEWVAGHLAPVINREITPNPGGDLAWDPNWWRHSEVVAPVHRAVVGLRGCTATQQRGPRGNVRVVGRPLRTTPESAPRPRHGALKRGEPRGNMEGHGLLAYEPPSEGWSSDGLADLPELQPTSEGEDAEPRDDPAFTRLEDFVGHYPCEVVNRKIDPQPGHGLAWDPRWWRHQEVVCRLAALWGAFEDARVAAMTLPRRRTGSSATAFPVPGIAQSH